MSTITFHCNLSIPNRILPPMYKLSVRVDGYFFTMRLLDWVGGTVENVRMEPVHEVEKPTYVQYLTPNRLFDVYEGNFLIGSGKVVEIKR